MAAINHFNKNEKLSGICNPAINDSSANLNSENLSSNVDTNQINELIDLNDTNLETNRAQNDQAIDIVLQNYIYDFKTFSEDTKSNKSYSKMTSLAKASDEKNNSWLLEAIGLSELLRMNKRQVLYQILNFLMIVSSALMIWKGLMVLTKSESPIVVVLSGSMEPAFYRGDLLFLTNFKDDPLKAGDIVVFKVKGRDIPIVHRIIKLHEK
ncbi:hypothetical protein RND71_043656 [Anisodus tanguticus]|uniref:signal peptidase I n=1 Tax=Anisodus tanguticus TaxID=243964 RepID=A0AAE1QP62_9SOLA|nr:hypothetical protein RND71_043656 [Anisodus tanguticus]